MADLSEPLSLCDRLKHSFVIDCMMQMGTCVTVGLPHSLACHMARSVHNDKDSLLLGPIAIYTCINTVYIYEL